MNVRILRLSGLTAVIASVASLSLSQPPGQAAQDKREKRREAIQEKVSQYQEARSARQAQNQGQGQQPSGSSAGQGQRQQPSGYPSRSGEAVDSNVESIRQAIQQRAQERRESPSNSKSETRTRIIEQKVQSAQQKSEGSRGNVRVEPSETNVSRTTARRGQTETGQTGKGQQETVRITPGKGQGAQPGAKREAVLERVQQAKEQREQVKEQRQEKVQEIKEQRQEKVQEIRESAGKAPGSQDGQKTLTPREQAKNRLEQLKARKGQAQDPAGQPQQPGQPGDTAAGTTKGPGGKGRGIQGPTQPGQTDQAGQPQQPSGPGSIAGTGPGQGPAARGGKGRFSDRLTSQEKARFIGANLKGDKFNPREMGDRFLSGDDVQRSLGNVTLQRPPLSPDQISMLRGGNIPPGVPPPPPGFGFMNKPLEPFGVAAALMLLPPPVPRVSLNVGNITLISDWNYWDGRSYYDHDYAYGMFSRIGHVRHGGFDGVLVRGRYYSYGYGWIDGCIDYGGHRAWVPGFWAPYTTTECCACPVWVPPVYEEVWTGCCWETVLVDGGYFDSYPDSECHTVTRWSWIPGHYQYYYS